jgi:hypothetical protein
VDWESTLRACNQNLGGRTAESWSEAREYLEIPPPLWGKGPRSGWNPPGIQARLHEKGIVVTGVFVRHDPNLGRLAPQDLAGDVVYGLDPWFSKDPEELLEIAESVFDAQEQENGREPDATEPSLPAGSELVRAFEVPRSLARDHQVFMTTIVVARKHLPGGVLADRTVPLLVDPDDVGTCTVLPSKYWPDALVDEWVEYDPVPPCKDHEALVIRGYGWPVPVMVMGSILAVDAGAEAITGMERAYKEVPWVPSLGFGLASVALFAFVRIDARHQPRRFLQPECGHRVDVTLDRRFWHLRPRTWGWILLALSVVSVLSLFIEHE